MPSVTRPTLLGSRMSQPSEAAKVDSRFSVFDEHSRKRSRRSETLLIPTPLATLAAKTRIGRLNVAVPRPAVGTDAVPVIL